MPRIVFMIANFIAFFMNKLIINIHKTKRYVTFLNQNYKNVTFLTEQVQELNIRDMS